MAAPASQQTATGHGESALTATAPPAYSEKEALGEGQAPMQQQAQPGGQLPQAQYPQGQYLLQTGGALPQTWPQGYLVSHNNYPNFPKVTICSRAHGSILKKVLA